MPTKLIAIQLALAFGGAMLGGPATKAGGALLLTSIAVFGASVGWRACGRSRGGE